MIYHCGDLEYYLTDEKLPLLSPGREHIILTEIRTIFDLEEFIMFLMYFYNWMCN